MPLPTDSILTAITGRISALPSLYFTDTDDIPVLSFKVEVADREPQLYLPIMKRVLLIGGKGSDSTSDPAHRAARALAVDQRVLVLGTERRREWFFGGVCMRGAQIEAAEVRQLESAQLAFRLGRAGDGIE
jgi:hypothetical protein